MSNYYGINSYPHGGRVSAFLLISMACALICTCTSVTSCRFLTLDYSSFYGDFNSHFHAQDPASELITHRVGVGLFTWLRPFDTIDWSDGHCSGYNQLQRNAIIDDMFEGVRAAGILAVLVAITVFLFSLGISCLSFNRFQRYAIVSCTLLCAALQGSAFLMTRSGLCTQVGVNPNCSIDQGGLIALAGVVLWMLTSLIGMFFIQPISATKLSPKMREQKKKEMKLHQLKMLRQLEVMELEQKLERSRRNRTRKIEADHQEMRPERQVESPPQSPSRRSSQVRHQSPTNDPQHHCSTHIPEVLPRSREDKRHPTGKHRQIESPKGSPRRTSNLRTSSRLDIYEAQQSSATLQSQPSIRMQPLKKRRLDRSEETTVKRNTRAFSLLDDESAGEVACRWPRRSPRHPVNDDDASDMAVQEYDSRMVFPNNGLTHKPAEKLLSPAHQRRGISNTDTDQALSNENVEVYISDHLNMTDYPISEETVSNGVKHQLCEV